MHGLLLYSLLLGKTCFLGLIQKYMQYVWLWEYCCESPHLCCVMRVFLGKMQFIGFFNRLWKDLLPYKT